MLVDACVDLLRMHGVRLRDGMSDAELREVENRFDFTFAPDHRTFLSHVLPTGDGWVDWRGSPSAELQRRVDWPTEGILFDVDANEFWPRSWGSRPRDSARRRDVATTAVSLWPRLVPLYSHRYMPAAPAGPGAPVFSVYQTDVIFYGRDLLDYLQREFGTTGSDNRPAHPLDPELCVPWSNLAFDTDIP